MNPFSQSAGKWQNSLQLVPNQLFVACFLVDVLQPTRFLKQQADQSILSYLACHVQKKYELLSHGKPNCLTYCIKTLN
jgi:hypothetical protein